MNGEKLAGEVLLTLLPVAMAALLGGAGVWLQEWRQHRNCSLSRRAAVADAMGYLSYLEKSLAIAHQLPREDAVGQALQWIEVEMAGVRGEVTRALTANPRTDRSYVRRLKRVLLIYPMRSAAAATLRAFAYVIAALGAGLMAGMANVDDTNPAYEELIIILIVTTPVWLLVLSFGLGAAGLERRWARAVTGRRSMQDDGSGHSARHQTPTAFASHTNREPSQNLASDRHRLHERPVSAGQPTRTGPIHPRTPQGPTRRP